MNGVDLGQIAQNLVNYLGGPAGGYMLAASVMVVGLLCAMHVLHKGAFVPTILLGSLAWTAAFIVKTIVGWA